MTITARHGNIDVCPPIVREDIHVREGSSSMNKLITTNLLFVTEPIGVFPAKIYDNRKYNYLHSNMANKTEGNKSVKKFFDRSDRSWKFFILTL